MTKRNERSKVEEIETTSTIKVARSQSLSKHPTSFKLSDTALDILSTLASKRGIAKSALIENLLRDEYQAEIEREKQNMLQYKSGKI